MSLSIWLKGKGFIKSHWRGNVYVYILCCFRLQKQRRTQQISTRSGSFPIVSEPSMGNTLTYSHQHTAEALSATTSAGSLCRWSLLLMQYANLGLSAWGHRARPQMLESLHSQILRELLTRASSTFPLQNFSRAQPLKPHSYFWEMMHFLCNVTSWSHFFSAKLITTNGCSTTESPEATEWWRMPLAFLLIAGVFHTTIALNPDKVVKIKLKGMAPQPQAHLA